MSTLKHSRAVIVFACFIAVAVSCSSPNTVRKNPTQPNTKKHSISPDVTAESSVRIGPAPDFEDVIKEARADSTPLQPAQTQQLLARLPALPDPQTLVRSSALDAADPPSLPTSSPNRTTEHPKTFELLEKNCTKRKPCFMGTGLVLKFSQPLKARDSYADLVSVEPKIEEFQIEQDDQAEERLLLTGATQPGTTYTVTLQPKLASESGQPLGESTEYHFYYKDALAALRSSADMLSVLDRDLNGHFPFTSINLTGVRARAYRVQPKDWNAYNAFAKAQKPSVFSSRLPRTEPAGPPGELVFDKTLTIDGVRNQFHANSLDLREALSEDGYGQIMLILEPIVPESDRFLSLDDRPLITWIQVTDLNLNARLLEHEIQARVLSRVDAHPLKDVAISLSHNTSAPRHTDADGRASVSLPKAAKTHANQHPSNLLIARQGNDIALLPPYLATANLHATHLQDNSFGYLSNQDVGLWQNNSDWRAQAPLLLTTNTRIFTLDDRGTYFPGETIRIKGWLRGTDEPGGRIIRSPHNTIYYTASWLDTPAPTAVKLDDSGGFEIALKLPDERIRNPKIEFHTDPKKDAFYRHRFGWLPAKNRHRLWRLTGSNAPYQIGQSIQFGLHAAPKLALRLGGARTRWTLRRSEAQYRPLGFDAYRFGRSSELPEAAKKSPQTVAPLGLSNVYYNGRLNPVGASQIEMQFERTNPPVPVSVQPHIDVTDINGNEWPTYLEPFVVFPGENLVGLRLPRESFDVGDTMSIAAIVVNLDRARVAGRPVEISAVRMKPAGPDTVAKADKKSRQDCKWSSSKTEKTCEFEAKSPGIWRITALTRDKAGHPAMSQIRVHVRDAQKNFGDDSINMASNGDKSLILRSDKSRYKPGETAHIRIDAPFKNARGFALITGKNNTSTQSFQITGRAHTLKVPLGQRDFSPVRVDVELTGVQKRPDASPDFLSAAAHIDIAALPPNPELSVELDASADANDQKNPPTRSIRVKVRDAHGDPVPRSLVTLSLAEPRTPSSFNRFLDDSIYQRYSGSNSRPAWWKSLSVSLNTQNTDHYILSENSNAALKTPFARDARRWSDSTMPLKTDKDSYFGEEQEEPKDEVLSDSWHVYGAYYTRPVKRSASTHAQRRAFKPAALFKRTIHTDESGEANIEIELPDLATRLPIRAVAVHGADSFGEAEAFLTVASPLSARPVLPDFVRAGEEFKLPVTVENTSDKAASIEVVARGSNLELTGATGQKLRLSPHSQATVYFNAVAGESGKGVIQAGVYAGKQLNSARGSVPILPKSAK